jgi:hypothetical protein
VVVTCYRQVHLVGDALASVGAQTYPHLEVVVVDDGSPPDEDPAPALAPYPEARLLRKPNGGVSSARNVGWRACRGEYVVFLDGDDLLLPHALSCGVDALAARPDCAFVHGCCERRTLDGRPLPAPEPRVGDFDHFEALLRGNFVRGLHAVMFRRAALVAVDGFDETQRFGQDWELYLRVARRFPAYGHGERIGVYRRHAGNVNSARNAAGMLAYSLLVLDKQRAAVGRDPRLRAAARAGRAWVRRVFGEPLAARVAAGVRARDFGGAWRDARVLLRHDPRRALRHVRRALARRLAPTRGA